MAYTDESPADWCERTWSHVWDTETVVRWEVETRASSFSKWAKHETLLRQHLKSARELEQAIERARANADPGARVRVLAWVTSYTRSQVATKSWPSGSDDQGFGDFGGGGVDDSPGLMRYMMGLLFQGRDVAVTTLIKANERLEKELEEKTREADALRAWKLDAHAVIEDMHDRKSTREAAAAKTQTQQQIMQSVVNTGLAKWLAHGSTDADGKTAAQVNSLLSSALGDFGKSLTDAQRQQIADALSPEQQLAFYLAVLPHDGGHERLEQLQEQRERARPSAELLTKARRALPPAEYSQLTQLLQKADQPHVDQAPDNAAPNSNSGA